MVTGAVSAAVTVAVAVAVTVLGLRDTRVVEVSYSGAVTVAVTDAVAATVALAAAVSVALADTVAVAVAVTAAVALTVTVTVTVLRPNHTSRFLISQFHTRTCDDMCLVGSHILFRYVLLNTPDSKQQKTFITSFFLLRYSYGTPVPDLPQDVRLRRQSGGTLLLLDVNVMRPGVLFFYSNTSGNMSQKRTSLPLTQRRVLHTNKKHTVRSYSICLRKSHMNVVLAANGSQRRGTEL